MDNIKFNNDKLRPFLNELSDIHANINKANTLNDEEKHTIAVLDKLIDVYHIIKKQSMLSLEEVLGKQQTKQNYNNNVNVNDTDNNNNEQCPTVNENYFKDDEDQSNIDIDTNDLQTIEELEEIINNAKDPDDYFSHDMNTRLGFQTETTTDNTNDTDNNSDNNNGKEHIKQLDNVAKAYLHVILDRQWYVIKETNNKRYRYQFNKNSNDTNKNVDYNDTDKGDDYNDIDNVHKKRKYQPNIDINNNRQINQSYYDSCLFENEPAVPLITPPESIAVLY